MIKYDYYEEYISECLTAYEYYVERHMSLRQVANNMMISFPTVKRRLLALKDIDIDKYDIYISETKRRNKRR